MDEPQHLTPETLEAYLAPGPVKNVRLATSPDCLLKIDPHDESLELWTPFAGREPDVNGLSRVSLSVESMDAGEWFVLRVDAVDLHYEGYTLLAAIVDQLKDGKAFARATDDAIEAYRDLLSGRGRMSQQKQIGLIGELLLLRHLFHEIGEGSALQSWLGPRSEEHDFILSPCDAEVKTTGGEAREHVIGSAMQLQRSPDRPLWLVSIQLTSGGTASNAFSLAGLVSQIRGDIQGELGPFKARLRALGWRDPDADLYMHQYLLRSKPAAYLVDDAFPAITQTMLEAHIARADLVGAVSYRVNVGALDAALPPEPLAGFVHEESS